MEVLGRRKPIRRLGMRLTAVQVMLLGVLVGAQGATAPALKAAFLFNFTKFAEWPVGALAPGQRLSLCILGDRAVAEALEQTIKTQEMADGHQLTVEVIKADGPIRSCHLLYVSGLDRSEASELLDIMKDTSAFTVSDGNQFAERGGVAQLIAENSRLRFAINVEAARRARLKISSKLLGLAQIVKDGHDVRR
jgi:hypothetical protein